MKKSSFTLLELVFVVAILILFAIMFNGCGKKNGPDGGPDGAAAAARARAQTSSCINNLRNLSTIGMCYLNDHRNFWYNIESRSYACSLARAKYIPDDMAGQDYGCPSVARDPGQQGSIIKFDQSNIQMYASVGDSRTGRNGFDVVIFNSSSLSRVVDHSDAVVADKQSLPSKRIWFADGLRPDTQRQRTLLITESYYNGRPDCARLYAIHEGRINVVAQDGHAASIEPKDLKEYYLPYFKRDNWYGYGVYSIRANTYISPEKPKKVQYVED